MRPHRASSLSVSRYEIGSPLPRRFQVDGNTLANIVRALHDHGWKGGVAVGSDQKVLVSGKGKLR